MKQEILILFFLLLLPILMELKIFLPQKNIKETKKNKLSNVDIFWGGVVGICLLTKIFDLLWKHAAQFHLDRFAYFSKNEMICAIILLTFDSTLLFVSLLSILLKNITTKYDVLIFVYSIIIVPSLLILGILYISKSIVFLENLSEKSLYAIMIFYPLYGVYKITTGFICMFKKDTK